MSLEDFELAFFWRVSINDVQGGLPGRWDGIERVVMQRGWESEIKRGGSSDVVMSQVTCQSWTEST